MANGKSTFNSWTDALPIEGVVEAYGFRRQGKTATVYALAEDLHKRGRPLTVLLPKPLVRKGRRLLPSWVKVVSDVNALRRVTGHTVLADEMSLQANARDHATDVNKEWAKLIAIVAQRHHLVFLICQHTRQLDVQLVMDADLVVFKRPSLLHIRFARPELRPEVQEAWDAFEDLALRSKKKVEVRSWAYLVDFHKGRRGFLRTSKPSFWSEDLSELFAGLELAGETGAKKKEVRPKQHEWPR